MRPRYRWKYNNNYKYTNIKNDDSSICKMLNKIKHKVRGERNKSKVYIS